jgi:hypothetical protein
LAQFNCFGYNYAAAFGHVGSWCTGIDNRSEPAAKSLDLIIPSVVLTRAHEVINRATTSGFGPTRHFAAMRNFGRYRDIADIE